MENGEWEMENGEWKMNQIGINFQFLNFIPYKFSIVHL